MLFLFFVQMRRKINDAFRRKQHSQKTEEDRISVTSEGSDTEVNEQGQSIFLMLQLEVINKGKGKKVFIRKVNVSMYNRPTKVHNHKI